MFFNGGNILEPKRLQEIWEKTIISLIEFSSQIKIKINIIDLGGGLGIPYSQEEKNIDFREINTILKELKEKYNLQEIWMELGRYCTGPYGYYLSKVIDRKRVRNKDLLVLDGGINHISRPTLTNQSFPCALFRESTSPTLSFNVHGPLCTALDKLGCYELPSDIKEGDWLIFSQAGAYGFTESMPFFLCHNLPGEIAVYNNNLISIRDSKSPQSWLI